MAQSAGDNTENWLNTSETVYAYVFKVFLYTVQLLVISVILNSDHAKYHQ